MWSMNDIDQSSGSRKEERRTGLGILKALRCCHTVVVKNRDRGDMQALVRAATTRLEVAAAANRLS